ncbi:MAG: SPFH domain-containing protein [Coprobacillus cateniformis]|uniref:SPFH domain-containing protein n=1 Tax=Longibaculum muris TaxID=1796628 RepID=UPI003AB67043|nr:SPFH domain-containing protein [Coprobacillus cateniformis]
MALFGKPKAGGFMDEIRCDEPSYLIWKWHPTGSQQGNNNRENAIRWGSSLRVREGSVAVFVYNQENGKMQDFIEGPFDQMIKTKNFPVLASLVGLAYEGGTPFQAEVYFINLAQIIQIKFGVPFFDVYDPRFLDFGVPTSVRGTLTFKIKDYREFIKLHRLDNFSLDDFQKQVRDAIISYVKNVVSNIPSEFNIPVIQLERKIAEITEQVEPLLKTRLEEKFGVSVSGFDISAIEIDKSSDGYRQLKTVTQDITSATVQAQSEVNIKNLHDMQRINAENLEETMRIQREEAQYAQHKQTEMANFEAFQVEKQAEVGVAGAEALGQMGANGAGGMSGGDMNPAAMMAGMMMGGAVGQNMAGMMNGMMSGVTNPQQGITPPPMPQIAYYVAMNGQATGPYSMEILTQMVANGSLTKDTYVWKQGMSEWISAGAVQELESLFNKIPPVPPVPNK